MGRHLPADAGSRNLAGSARLDAKGRARLLGLARDLAGALAELRRLRAARPGDPRGDAALLLDLKVVPELARGLDLPLFLGFQGGTNTGKSTLFNALAGKLLSPAIPTGSATKHPLVFAHERWRGRLLDAPLFPGFEARQLEDPKRLIVDPERTDLLYVRLHDDARLERLALVDSPDFDGALETNAAGAAAIAAISDVTLFVTTAEKYRDRILVDQLRRLLELKDDVLVVFNRLGEPIVFETLADDLRSVLGPPGAHLRAARLPSSAARHPEDDLRAALVDLTAPLAALDVARTKEATLSRTVRRVAALAAEAAERCSADAELKRELQRIVREGEEECAREYRASFRLAFPEETLAIRRVLRETEVFPRLEALEVEKTRRGLALVGSALKRLSDAARRLVVRPLSDEGTLEPGPAALEEYARARNRADGAEVARLAEGLRLRLEAFLRPREDLSPLAREVLRSQLTAPFASELAARSREAHAEALAAARGTGDDVLACAERWLAARPRRARALGLAAIAFKLAAGVAAAWALPPSQGLLSVLSPLDWLWFAAGWLAAAYAIAVAVALRLRGRKRYLAARERVLRSTLRRVLLDPFSRALDEVLREPAIDRVRALSRELAERCEARVTPVAPVTPAELRSGGATPPAE